MTKLEELWITYSNRNLLEELEWERNTIKEGYISKEKADFLTWLFDAAYKKIKELDNE